MKYGMVEALHLLVWLQGTYPEVFKEWKAVRDVMEENYADE